MNTKKTVFLTGATGLVGSYLLKILLQNYYKVYVLARNDNDKTAYDRVANAIGFWGEQTFEKYLNNLVVLQGDITEPNLCLENKSIELLCDEIEEIFHCAAATKFNSSPELLRKVNVTGARNLFDLSLYWQKNGKLQKVNHISTVYICGDYKNIFTEEDLDVGQKFNTPYEQSKFEAEKLAIKYRKNGLWVDIFRPPAVAGESTTGKILKFDQAMYQALRVWNSEIFDFFPCDKNQYFYMVPVDELCESIFLVSSTTSKRNKNYHPFISEPIPLQYIIETASNFLGFKKPILIASSELDKNKISASKRIILENIFLSVGTHLELDSSSTISYLKQHGVALSSLDEKILLKMFKYAVQRGFLKTK